MKKKILFAFLFFGLCLAIAYPVKAGAFKVKCPKKITVKLGQEKEKKYKAYFKGHNVTDACEPVSVVKGNKGHAVKVDSDVNTIYVNSNKTKRKSFTVKIKFCFSPCEYYHAEEDYVNDGYVYCEKLGHITSDEYYNEFVFTKKIKIRIKKKKKLKISSEIIEYFTRENYFEVKIKNNSYKTLTILPTGSKAYDCDYKKYDRNLRTGKYKNIKIKPGKSKYVKLYVIGSTTWPVAQDFTIKVRIKYKGKVYKRKIE